VSHSVPPSLLPWPLVEVRNPPASAATALGVARTASACCRRASLRAVGWGRFVPFVHRERFANKGSAFPRAQTFVHRVASRAAVLVTLAKTAPGMRHVEGVAHPAPIALSSDSNATPPLGPAAYRLHVAQQPAWGVAIRAVGVSTCLTRGLAAGVVELASSALPMPVVCKEAVKGEPLAVRPALVQVVVARLGFASKT